MQTSNTMLRRVCFQATRNHQRTQMQKQISKRKNEKFPQSNQIDHKTFSPDFICLFSISDFWKFICALVLAFELKKCGYTNSGEWCRTNDLAESTSLRLLLAIRLVFKWQYGKMKLLKLKSFISKLYASLLSTSMSLQPKDDV